MKILQILDETAKREKKRFLLIGGHAVNAHGYPRQTADLDILVSREDRDYWEEILKKLSYEPFQRQRVFSRWKPPTLGEWPIDLMYVARDVFEELLEKSEQHDFGLVAVAVPSKRHLVSLKLHALSQRQGHRESKDLLDVIELFARSNLTNDQLRELCEKYDRIDLYPKIVGTDE